MRTTVKFLRNLVLGLIAFTACLQSSFADEPAYGANSIYDTSEYALGSHTLNVVFIQDDILRDPNDVTHPPDTGGQIVHWTAAEIVERQQRVTDAVNTRHRHRPHGFTPMPV